MSDAERAKRRAAEAAAELVEPGMVVGLGTGSTAALMLESLGRRLAAESLTFTGVATSEATTRQARKLGIPLKELDQVGILDLNLDGADEVDHAFRMIKGRGGALHREKIVASSARRCVIMITPDKRVEELGRGISLPVEVSEFGLRHTERRLNALGARTTVREDSAGRYRTDGGNAIIDCKFDLIADPELLDRELRLVAGVLDTGFFFNLCHLLIVGHDDRVERFEPGVPTP